MVVGEFFRSSAVAHIGHISPSPGTEDMLGVEFLPCAAHVSTHTPVRAIVRFLYHPSVNYDALKPGAEFEIVEGPHVVGRAKVVAR